MRRKLEGIVEEEKVVVLNRMHQSMCAPLVGMAQQKGEADNAGARVNNQRHEVFEKERGDGNYDTRGGRS